MATARSATGTALLAAGLLLTACASPASPAQMALAAGSPAQAHQGEPAWRALTVGVIDGGAKTSPLWLSDVSNADFRTALETSLRNLDFLADGARGAYVVTARIVDVDVPLGARDPVLVIAPVAWEVTVKVRYTVTPTGGGVPVFDDVVAATATGSSGFSATARVRKAAEAAVRADIETFAQRLGTEWNGRAAG